MSAPASASASSSRRGWLVAVLLVALLVGGGLAIRSFWPRKTPPTADLVAAAQANARGVGQMEQFEYAKAIPEFEEAVRLAPDWLPARINLGMALYNSTQGPQDPVLDRAISLFRDVLAQDPDNPYAHYNLGIILLYRNQLAEAAPHFEAVTRIDPKDAHAWYHRGVTHPEKDDSPQAKEYFRKALELNPYLNAARYQLAQHGHERSEEATRKLLAEHRALVEANWEDEYGIKYSEMGRYAEVIGRSPTAAAALGPVPMFEPDATLAVKLAEGTRWATPAEIAPLPRAVRERFGGSLLRLDYDADGKPDLLLLAAVIRGGQPGDLLLHNDGNGSFTDRTPASGFGPSLGGVVADLDNDGRPDLLLTGPTGVRLWRNEDGQRFTDQTAQVGLADVGGAFLGTAAVDLDQDGDLDILLARYARTAAEAEAEAVARLGGRPTEGGEAVVLLNVAEAPPVPAGAPTPPLKLRFRSEPPTLLGIRGPVTSFVLTDIDADRDVDILALLDGEPPVLILNDRLLRFRRGAAISTEGARWNGGAVLEANGDEQSDLFFLAEGSRPRLLVSSSDALTMDVTNRFAAGHSDSPPLLQAECLDLDLDGRADVVGLSRDRQPVFLQGDGQGKLNHLPAAFGPAAQQVPNLLAVAACDLDGDCDLDLVTWSADTGLGGLRNQGNGNRRLVLELTGRRDKGSNLRTNSDGIGARVIAHAGPLRTAQENTTLAAGLGQSRLPLSLGLGQAASAETVRVRWPDGVPQAELNLPTCERVRITELNRKGTSCPILLTWDGQRFRYITDFLGGGALGELLPDGSVRPPRPEESVRIEAGSLVPRQGRYVLKIAEPMDEVLYLDHLRLEVIDHPATVEIHPDERFATGGPAPTQKLLSFSQRHAPVRAVDHRGREVTDTLRLRDGKRVEDFALRSWLGFAEEHFIELNFGDQLAAVTPGQDVYLVLAGWIDYPYPESIYAAAQAGVSMQPPLLERRREDGTWEPIGELGFPAGLPKVMTRPLHGLAGTRGLQLRIRTNLQVYWDQVYLAVNSGCPGPVTSLPVCRATLAHRGFMQEVSPTPRGPIEYNDDRTEPVAVTRWQGRLTRTGEVTPLLTARDDRFVLCGPGDEVTVEFDAAGLPSLPPGHVRTFVLRTAGYCKDTAPFTATGGQVGPLPFRGMASYPQGAADRAKAPAGQDEYDRQWNTRPAGGR